MRRESSSGKFIARDQEQEWALAAVLAGRGAAIVGPAGVGRTALVSAVTGRLNAARFEVIWTAATEASRQVPFGAFNGLLSDNNRSNLPLTQGRLVAELTRRAGQRTLVLVIDDAHNLDSWSATLALSLASDGDVRLLVTARSGTLMSDAVVALWKDGYLRRLDIAPFDNAGTTQLVSALLGGAAAGPTVVLLHQWTSGNPLFLTELVRHGRAVGSMVEEGGLWWWRGSLTVPPRLAELFDHRLQGFDTEQQDALAAVALGEPLPLKVLEEVVPGVVESLEKKGLLHTTDGDGEILVRLGQPMLGAALRHRLPRLRRRRLAIALLDASARFPTTTRDRVARARWQVEADDPVDVKLLVSAADTTYRNDPELACRVARRALERSDAGTVPLTNALVELGDAAQARVVLEQARAAASTPRRQLRLSIALAAHRCWVDRDPSGAHEDLLALRSTAPSRTTRALLDGVDSLVLLFGGRGTEALRVAQQALHGSARGRGPESARLALAASLALAGRTADAVDSAAPLVAATSSGWVGPSYVPGAAAAVLAFAELWQTTDVRIPSSDPAFGRWPDKPECNGRRWLADDGVRLTEWSLLGGYARRVAGNRQAAIVQLREALVQQSYGHRLFRTEAVSWLAVCLAEERRPDAAERLLDAHRPDGVGIIPGQSSWAVAAVAAARGDLATALASMDAAVSAARAAGCWSVELEYLTYTAWLAPGNVSVSLLGRLTTAMRHVDARLLIAGAEAVLALSRGDGAEILGHAIRLEAVGSYRQAWRLAEAAIPALTGQGGVRRGEAVVLAGRLRGRLGISASAAPPAALTLREVEIASMAAGGLPDREISRRLALSVRTVQSHLARIYRKLGVHSRRDLPPGLHGG
jgi:DNA-binding CsgD family transcriptional regulator